MAQMSTRAAKPVQVKNRSAAAIQITAEQIVLEARDRAMASAPPPPKRHIADVAELREHRMSVRKDFEDKLKFNKNNLGTWLRYAKWEEEQHEIERARSIYERALDIDYKNVPTWLRYAEMEMRAKFPNRARNVWDRAITLLPRVSTFWYKYTFMEELLGNKANARAIFDRWMEWEPTEQSWQAYIGFEQRSGEVDKARAVWERFLACHPSQQAYIRFAKWEMKHGQKALARRVYERALEELRDSEKTEALYLAFGAFEEMCGELERARVVFKFGLDHLPKADASHLYQAHVAFEKKHGDRKGIEDVITSKRRLQYEQAVTAQPLNYDAWFDYIRLEENSEAEGEGQADAHRVRSLYERAIANVPPIAEKRYWRRYVYLWLNYALYEETVTKDYDRARQVYAAALKVVPHRVFTFGKLWLQAAQFEVRRLDLAAARKLLGTSLGMCPKENVIRAYIDLELRLGEVERVRKLYEKQVATWPFNAQGWCKFAALEAMVGETERARAIYEISISQPLLDMPELCWKSFIDFEIETTGETANARSLYERLLSRTQHSKVWLSYAAFEASIVGSADGARRVYRRAYDHFKQQLQQQPHQQQQQLHPSSAAALADEATRDDRALIAQTWLAFEQGIVEDEEALGGDVEEAKRHLDAVAKLQPRKVVKRRPILAGDGSDTGQQEEYSSWLFPDDEAKPASLKLLEMAQKWKRAGGGDVNQVLQATASVSSSTSSSSSSSTGMMMMLRRQDTGVFDNEAVAADQPDGALEGDSSDSNAYSGGAAAGLKRSAATAFGDTEPEGPGGDEESAGGSNARPSKMRRTHDSNDSSDGNGDEAPTPVGGPTADPNAVDLDALLESEGNGPAASIEGGITQPMRAQEPPQAGAAASDPDDDAANALAAERELEDRVRAAATSAEVPRDLYSTEERGGVDADRD